MEARVENASHYLRPPKKWAVVKRESPTRIGWDVVGVFETKQEADAALKRLKSKASS
jgi:hypothetical protein